MSAEKPIKALETRLVDAAKVSVCLIIAAGIVMGISGEDENLRKLFHFPELLWAFGLFFILCFAFS